MSAHFLSLQGPARERYVDKLRLVGLEESDDPQARRQGGFHVAWKPPPPPRTIVNVNNLLKLELDLFAIELIAITILLQRIFGTARYAHAQNAPLRAICGRGLSKFRRAQARDLYRSPLFKILPTPLIHTAIRTRQGSPTTSPPGPLSNMDTSSGTS